MKRPVPFPRFLRPPSQLLRSISLLLVTALPLSAAGAADEKMADEMPADRRPAAKSGRPAKAAKADKSSKPAKAPAAAPSAGLPSMDDLRQLLTDKKYPELLKALARVTNLRGSAAEAYDKHELWKIKGEAHLQMKNVQAAGSAFREAAEEAPDAQTKAEAEATGILIKRAKNFVYTPKAKRKGAAADPDADGGEKPGPVEPIDVLDAEKRRAGFQALFDEEMATAGPKVKAAQRAKSLTEIAKAMKAMSELRSLELAATGGNAQTSETVDALAGRATELMKTTVDRLYTRVHDIEQRANKLIEYQVRVGGPLAGIPRTETRYRKRGLERRDMTELRDAIDTCKQLVPAAESLADSSEPRRDELQEIALKAEDVGQLAVDTLEADYSVNARP